MGSLRSLADAITPWQDDISLADILSEMSRTPDSMEEACRRIEVATTLRFVSFNTFLMYMRDVTEAAASAAGSAAGALFDALVTGLTGGAVPPGTTTVVGAAGTYRVADGVLDRTRKPAVDARSHEIGPWLDRRVDIAALSEVWRTVFLDRIVEGYARAPIVSHHVTATMPPSSGLATIVRPGIVQFVSEEFTAFEDASGADQLATKGVLVTRLQTAHDAPLHIVSIHLDAGDDLVRAKQLFQLSAVLDRLDRANGHIVVSGDFNYDGRSRTRVELDAETIGMLPVARREEIGRFRGTGYDLMRAVLAWHGLDDIWGRVGTAGYTGIHGAVNLAPICSPLRRYPEVCNERMALSPADTDAVRLDYIFVSRPYRGMRYHLDCSRPWRAVTLRDAGATEREEIAYLSDHLPVRTDLYLSSI